MRFPTMLVSALCVLVPQALHPQQLPDFAQVIGFQLPSVRSGQFAFSLNSQFLRGPDADSAWSTVAGSQSIQLNTNHLQKRLQFRASFLFGVDDRTSLSISASGLPEQSTGDESYVSGSAGWPSLGFPMPSTTAGVTRLTRVEESSLFVECLIAHRPRQNLELSLGGYHSTLARPSANAEGQKEIRPFPYLVGTDQIPDPFDPVTDLITYPRFPDIAAYRFQARSSSHQKKFGINAGVTIISDNEITTNYARPFGFLLPSVPQGEFIASLNLRYERQPTGNSRIEQTIDDIRGGSILLTGHEVTDFTQSIFRGEACFIYGLSNKSTASIQLNMAPDQSSTDETFASRYYVTPAVWHNRDRTGNGRLMDIHVVGGMVSRPTPGVELSLGVDYKMQRTLQKAGTIMSFNYDISSIARQRYNTSSIIEQKHCGIHLGVAALSDELQRDRYLPLRGYQVPILAKGQFAFDGGTTFYVEWGREATDVAVKYSYDSESGQSAGTAANWRSPTLRIKSSFLYGLLDDFTVLVSLDYTPNFTYGDRAFTYVDVYSIPAVLFTGVFREEILATGLTVAYRPDPGVEVRLCARYSDTRQLSSGSTYIRSFLLPPKLDEMSSMRRREFGIHADITLFGFQ